MRAHKAEKYKVLKQTKNKAEFEKIFFNYNPDTIKEKKEQEKMYKSKTSKNKTKTKNKIKKSKLSKVNNTRRKKFFPNIYG